jgi:hypothetical protein
MKEFFDCTVGKDGKLPVGIANQIKEIVKNRAGKFLRFILTNEKTRTIPQNSWFHVVVKIISDFLRQQAKDQGNEKYYEINEETTKLLINQKFLGYEEINGERHLRKSRNLKTFEMAELWADLQRYFSPMGLNIPDPNQQDFIKDKVKTKQ